MKLLTYYFLLVLIDVQKIPNLSTFSNCSINLGPIETELRLTKTVYGKQICIISKSREKERIYFLREDMVSRFFLISLIKMVF